MNSINERIESLVAEFPQNMTWEDRYKKIMAMGREMADMDEEYKTEANKVKGCQSQVWFHVELQDGRLYFQGDSDASIVKGIAALLFKVYDGATIDEVLSTKPTFLEDIGLRQHLSMSRANGLTAMLKQIGLYALAFKARAQMEQNS